jgi:guanylate kinase
VSVTTRPPRPGESIADYEFVTEGRFAALAANNKFLERATVYGHRYGTPRAFVEECLDQGTDVLLILEAQGRRQLAQTHAADLVSVFLLPPDGQELERRLRDRGQDGEESLARRLAAARQEMACSVEYAHVLVNQELDVTLKALDKILCAERRHRGGRSAAEAS